MLQHIYAPIVYDRTVNSDEICLLFQWVIAKKITVTKAVKNCHFYAFKTKQTYKEYLTVL